MKGTATSLHRWVLPAIAVALVGCSDDENGAAGGNGGVAWSASAQGGAGGSFSQGGSTGGSTGGDGGSGGSSASGGSAAAPRVIAITPSDGVTAVRDDTDVTVTFSETMDPNSATTSGTGACSGSLQLSMDGFNTCVALSSPTTTDDVTFSVTPIDALTSAGLFQLRATEDLASASATSLLPGFQSAGFTVRYANPIVIDGTNDFAAADELASSTVGARLFVSYDDTHLYLGFAHVDIVTGGAGNRFVYFLLSTDPTLSTGNAGSSDDKAAFGASGRMMFHYKEQIDGGDYSEFRIGSTADWDSDWGTQNKTVFKADGYLEASIALSELGVAVSDVIVTAYTIDYNGDGGAGFLYNMLPAAVAGSGATPRNLAQYVHVQLPTSLSANAPSALKSF